MEADFATTFRAMATKEQVREYWEARPCGTSVSDAQSGSPEFFAEVEHYRYQTEPCIPRFARFESTRGKRVLEIGTGAATDFINFARAGADLTGVDLTAAAVDLAQTRLGNEGLQARVLRADAENLPFDDQTFDVVYSWGVLHHTPDTERAIQEVHRVLADGGEARIMLYSRRSWLALGYWARHAAMAGRPWRSFAEVIAHHVESDGTKAYTRSELRRMFTPFADVQITPFLTTYDIRVGRAVARAFGDRFGWFVGITARR
jgi:ubiquinone/menaquinone biosynthesis C-methylase UbiE